MSIPVDKALQKKAPLPGQRDKGKTSVSAQLKDQRQEAAVQTKRQQMVNESDRIRQLSAQQRTIQRQLHPNGLPPQLKAGVENLSGIAMDDVRVHYNSPKPAQLQAHAYAQGTDIHLAPGQEKHLAHEAWHVVQQKQGRVRPTMQLKGKVNINDDATLEREADVMGAKAFPVNGAIRRGEKNKGFAVRKDTVQRVLEPGDPAPTIGALLGKRFQIVIGESGALPAYNDLLQETRNSLNAYAQGAPAVLASNDDCARYGIGQAIAAGQLNNVHQLQTFVTMARAFSMGQVQALALHQGTVDQLIEDQVKIALHNAFKSTTHTNISAGMGIPELVTVIRNNIQHLSIPPQTPAQLFCIALERRFQAHPFNSFHSFQQFKAAVMNTTIHAVGEQYFAQLPGDTRQKLQILRNASRFGQQRFGYWERTYLKHPHAGLADAQTAVAQVNVANTMNLNDLPQSYANISEAAGNAHLAAHPQNPAFNELNGHNSILLSKLLLNMPVVQEILDDRPGHGLDTPIVNPTWQNAAVFASQDNPMKAKEAQSLQSPAHPMQVRIRTALRKVNNLVENAVLAHSETPNVVLHKDLNALKALLNKKYDNVFGFRAFANNRGNQVNVGLDTEITVLMHEMGHLIEDNLGTKEWLDILSLLHMRHNNAPGGNQLSHVYDKGLRKGVALVVPDQARKEPAYKGEMPVTGRYSAKFYGSGSTEVMSMTIEYFGSPEKARRLINEDPLQAAIILRALQPGQFQQYVVNLLPAVTTWLP